MITECGIKQLKKYCREPIENIKGYREAVESEGRYECHHINELTFTRDELKKMKMYYDRPASELVILKCSEHAKLHCKKDMPSVRGRYDTPRRSWEEHPKWKGEKAGTVAMYKRALKLYRSGQILEEEFQSFRDKLAEYMKLRREQINDHKMQSV